VIRNYFIKFIYLHRHCLL